MNRYQKIDPRFWKDEKIVTLVPEDKLIALYIFTGQSNRIGLFSFSPGEAAEDVGMLPQTFAERFRNVCVTLNLRWDETFRVLYLPTWWKYNPPENANNVVGNLKDLDDVPKSDLVDLFRENLDYLAENLRETFTQTLVKRYPQRLPKRSPSQEQEQEQDIKSGAKAPESSSNKRSRKLTRPDPAQLRAFEAWYTAYPKHVGRKPALKAWLSLDPDPAQIEMIMTATLRYVDVKAGVEPRFILDPATWINQERWADEIGVSNANGNGKPTHVKDLGDGFVEVDGRRMDKRTAERRGFNATT